MADNNTENQTPSSSPLSSSNANPTQQNQGHTVGADDSAAKFAFLDHPQSKIIMGALLFLVIVLGSFNYWRSTSKEKDQIHQKDLGPAYTFLSQGQVDSARVALQNYVSVSRPTLALSKAYLLLGRLYFSEAKYAEALDAYKKVTAKHPLLAAAGLYGQAASQMQLGDYASALTLLETLVSDYHKETGDMQLRGLDREPADVVPGLSNVLYKLALCYEQMGKKDLALEQVQKLLKAYPDSPDAQKAKRLLVSLS